MNLSTLKTPGVYIQELDAFGNSVVPIPTAVPAFVGYTKNTQFEGKELVKKAVKVTSWTQFCSMFGNTPPVVKFNLSDVETPVDNGFEYNHKTYQLQRTGVHYRMYSAVKFFYENGGGDCFILSVGAYDSSLPHLSDIDPFIEALTLLENEREPTMVLIPDVVEFDTAETALQDRYANAYSLQNQLIDHCGRMKCRVAILDIPGGYEVESQSPNAIEQFRGSVSPILEEFRSYSAAYYPWLHTTVYQSSDVSYANLTEDSYTTLENLLRNEFTDENGQIAPDLEKIITAFSSDSPKEKELSKANKVLMLSSQSFKKLINHILTDMNLLGPSNAMAGLYATVDSNDGVWNAPANINVQSVIKPAIDIDSATQEDLNVPNDGKAICAIRYFTGRGNLVWGGPYLRRQFQRL